MQFCTWIRRQIGGMAFLERDLALVYGVGQRQVVGFADGLIGCLEDEPQETAFVAGAGLLDRRLNRGLELL